MDEPDCIPYAVRLLLFCDVAFIGLRCDLPRQSFEGIAHGDLRNAVLPFSAHADADVP